MKKITLYIKNPYERETVVLEDEVTIGRTDASQVVLSDTGLSRKNTTFFRDGDACFVVDENSLNGTFVNSEKVSGAPQRVFDGDVIKLGTETQIAVEIRSSDAATGGSGGAVKENPKPKDQKPKTKKPKTKNQKPKTKQLPVILMVAGGSAVVILVLGVIALIVANSLGIDNKNAVPTPRPASAALIPVRVIDPLGGEDPDDINDLISSWEIEETTLKAEDVEEIKTVKSSKETPNVPTDLNVTKEFFDQQIKQAESRPGSNEPLRVLLGSGISKQRAKLKEMVESKVYKQPLDFADLAEMHLNGDLVELPVATQYWVLSVGGDAKGGEFTSFEWGAGGNQITAKITPGTPKYAILKRLADNFYGQKYDLENSIDRQNMRRRLLRMFNRDSRKMLEELCKAYYEKFNRPVKITSLIRTLDYQIYLGTINGFAAKVSVQNSYSPHTSGCAFDVGHASLSNEGKNFLMVKLDEWNDAQKGDAIIESGNCFHAFIYYDGRPPGQKSSQQQPTKQPTKQPTTKPLATPKK